MALSEDNKDRLNSATTVIKTVVHWSWLPIVLAIGFTQSNPRPSLIRLFSPLA